MNPILIYINAWCSLWDIGASFYGLSGHSSANYPGSGRCPGERYARR